MSLMSMCWDYKRQQNICMSLVYHVASRETRLWESKQRLLHATSKKVPPFWLSAGVNMPPFNIGSLFQKIHNVIFDGKCAFLIMSYSAAEQGNGAETVDLALTTSCRNTLLCFRCSGVIGYSFVKLRGMCLIILLQV